ncbi:MAG: PEP-CTERM sorting domain-containing protein, partial [Proteobacteria bacterium]|nr:PEP-CTERM sorting domain-containing protein [Pseudomonadota bacterium]
DIVLGVGGDETLFASAAALMLVAGDEIDALVVFDDDGDGVFSGTDQVLFSLAAGSPTLIVLGASPADVLSITFGGVLGVFATAAELGLDPDDELNMLELVPLVGGDAGATILVKVPEPSTTLLLTTALLGVGLAIRKRSVR